MLRKLLSNFVPYRSVREELRTSGKALGRAVRSFRMESAGRKSGLKDSTGIKLNVACGGLVREGWLNVDLYPPAGALYLDVVNGLPFAPGSVRQIHCEHFLEHLRYDDAERFLAECHRALMPGGAMRIVVPDAEKYIRAYSSGDRVFFQKLIRLGYTDDDMVNPDLDTPIKVVNQMVQMGGEHKFAWDFDTLSKTAKGAGFSEVSRSSFGDAVDGSNIDGTDEWRLIESLYAVLRK